MKQRWLPLAILFLASLIPFVGIIIGGKQLGPTEHIQTMLTPGSTTPEYGWDVLQADSLLQFLPWRDSVFESWRSFQAPLVNPYQLSGQPLAANSQSGAFYPLHLLFAFLPLSTAFKMVLLAIVHLFIGSLGVYLWTRHMQLSKQAAIMGGILFATSQFASAWTPLASVVTTVAWIPWVFAGLTHPNRKKGVATVALAIAMMITAGHLQFAAYGLIAAASYALIITIRERSAWKAMGIICGLVVVTPFILQVLANSEFSHRKNTPSAEGYNAYIKTAIQPFELLGAVHPKLLGDPSVRNSDLGDSKLPSGYWPLYKKNGANPAESALWLAPLALALLPLAFFRKKQDKAQIVGPTIIGLLGGLLALGTPLNQVLYFYVPGWSATGSPGRAHVLLILGVIALASFGYDELRQRSEGSKRWGLLALVPFVALGIGFNLMNMVGGMLSEGSEDSISAIITATTKPHLVTIALSALLGAVAIYLLTATRTRIYGLALTCAFGLFNVPLAGKAVELPTVTGLSSHEHIAFASSSWNIAQTPKAFMPPNFATLLKLHDLFGYDSILDGRYVNKLKELTGAEPAPPENGNMMLFRPTADAETLKQRLSAFGATAVVTPERTEPIAMASKRVVPNIGEAEITSDGFDHQTLKCSDSTTEILIRDRYYKWITSSTSNVTIEERDGFRLVKCKPGTKEIRLDYGGSFYKFAVVLLLIITVYAITLILKKENESNPS